MKKLLLILLLLFAPTISFSQYTLEWETIVDTTGGNGFASKVIETPIREIFVTISNSSRVPFIKKFDRNGTWLRNHKYSFTNFQKGFQNFNPLVDSLYIEEYLPNTFILDQKSMIDLEYFGVFRRTNDERKFPFYCNISNFSFNQDYITMEEMFEGTKRMHCIAPRGYNYLYLDISPPTQNQFGELFHFYSIEEKDIEFKSINKTTLSEDSISKDPTVGYGVPRALKYFADSSMVVVISSEEVPTSKPIGISFRIVDKTMQEIGAFRILNDSQYTNYNVSIVDAAVLNDNIYVVGYEYLPNSTLKRGFIATVTKQGQFLGYKYLTPEGIYSKIQAVKIHGNSVVCVGAMSDSPDNLNIVPYLVSYDSGLDEATKKEYKWTDTGINSLYDYVVTFDNNAIVVGSKGGKPYMAKLIRDPKTSVVESKAVGNSSTRLLPNPSSTEATISMMNRTSMEGTISLYSVDGKILATLHSGEIAQNFEFSFSTANYPNGFYFVMINGEEFQETIPLTIQR